MKTYYMVDSAFADKVFWDQEPICIDYAEIERFAKEWEMATEDLLQQFHEASNEEIKLYGTYDHE